MIPDKIYIQENDHSMRYGVNQDSNIKGMHEYICKEALLERISNLYFSTYEKAERSKKDEDIATQNAFAVVIDEIKSM